MLSQGDHGETSNEKNGICRDTRCIGTRYLESLLSFFLSFFLLSTFHAAVPLLSLFFFFIVGNWLIDSLGTGHGRLPGAYVHRRSLAPCCRLADKLRAWLRGGCGWIISASRFKGRRGQRMGPGRLTVGSFSSEPFQATGFTSFVVRICVDS
jgi:hypothetical protein